jgi:hypothetical protein
MADDVLSRIWRRVRERAFDATIVGGVLAMPIAVTATIISDILPTHVTLRHCGGVMLGIAAAWFALALVCAHLSLHRVDRDKTAR